MKNEKMADDLADFISGRVLSKIKTTIDHKVAAKIIIDAGYIPLQSALDYVTACPFIRCDKGKCWEHKPDSSDFRICEVCHGRGVVFLSQVVSGIK